MEQQLKQQLESGASALHHVDTDDRGGPALEPQTGVRRVDRGKMLAEVAGGAAGLRATDETADRSAPVIDPAARVQHVDRTAQLQTIRHGAAMREVAAGAGGQLRATDESADRSAPAIEPGTKIRASHRADLMREVVEAPRDLRGVADEERHDVSAPQIETVQVTVHAPVLRTAVLRDIEAKHQQQ